MEVSSWNCECGRLVQATDSEVMKGAARCPACGAVLRPSLEHTHSAPSLEETQTINLEDMARMAQTGVDVSISGEWDTSEPNEAKERKS
jgi:hypothetical protein